VPLSTGLKSRETDAKIESLHSLKKLTFTYQTTRWTLCHVMPSNLISHNQ